MPSLNLTAAPTGWRLSATPTTTRSGSIARDTSAAWDRQTISQRYADLLAWANENSLQLDLSNHSAVAYNEWAEIYYWTTFTLATASEPDNERFLGAFTCPGCASERRPGDVLCTCDSLLLCDTCRLAGARIYPTTPGMKIGTCPRCSVTCAGEGCSNMMPANSGFTKCSNCEPRAACSHCSKVVQTSMLTEHTDNKKTKRSLCETCHEQVCPKCNSFGQNVREIDIEGESGRMCKGCVQKLWDEKRAQFEKWSADELPKGGSLLIPSTTQRPTRTVSIETEFDGNGVEVGRALFSAGLIASPDRSNYSSQGNASAAFPCILKSDGSVSGGELVSYLLDLDNENHAAALMRMTEVMRSCRELNFAKFTHRAGGHVHIDLHDYTAQDLWNLYTLFKYNELAIFYLGGAGADYGHRTLAGSGYTDPPKAGPFGTKKEFLNQVRHLGRDALHFGTFLSAMRNCQCGSQLTGEWDTCECNLGKATAEWRVWNAEITPRILHAWLSFMQAMTAYAQENVIIESDYPYLNWSGRRFNALPAAQIEPLKARLEWMHRELPLTAAERDSLVYAMKRSELIGLGEDYLDSLLQIESNSSLAAKKKPRQPASRVGTQFKLAAVSAEATASADFSHFETVGPEYYDDDYDDESSDW